MAKALSDTARIILAAAAGRADLHLLPLPTTLKAPGVIIRKTIGMLIQSGLVQEVPSAPGEPVWEVTGSDAPVALAATAAGLAAIGVESEGTAPTDANPVAPAPRSSRAARGGAKTKAPAGTGHKAPQGPRRATSGPRGRSGGQSKQDACIALLRRENGANIPEMAEATGWQSHSIRGFMSGALKKRLGLEVISEKSPSGERRYYIGALRTEAEQH